MQPIEARITGTEAARLLGINPDTLARWERDGKVTAERTAGGHRRYFVAEIERLLLERAS